MGQGVHLAPCPVLHHGPQGGLQMRHGGAPRIGHHLGAGFHAWGVAPIPPRRLCMGGQTGQGLVGHAGAQKQAHPLWPQLIGHGLLQHIKGQLVGQGRGNFVGPVLAIPSQQQLDPHALLIVGGGGTQVVRHGSPTAHKVICLAIQLQGLGVAGIPALRVLTELLVQASRPVTGVVITRDHGGPCGLVVGRHDEATRRVFLLGVALKRQKTQFDRFASGVIQDARWVHPVGANDQSGRCPPSDVALRIGPHHVQTWRVDQAGRLARFVQGVGAVELVKGFDDGVFGLVQRPPQGQGLARRWRRQGIVDQRPVRRTAHLHHHAVRAFDGDGFFAHAQVHPGPLVPDAVGVFGVHRERHQIGVVVLEHGQVPTKITVVPQQGHGVERQEVAIQLKARAAQMGLVPNSRHGVGDVRVSRQQGPPAGRALARYRPSVAALEHRHARHIHGRMRPAHPLAGIAQRGWVQGHGRPRLRTRRCALGQRHRLR